MYTDISTKVIGEKFIGYTLDTDEEAIKNSILNLFIIQKGTVPGYPEFGNPLNITVFDLFDFFTAKTIEINIKNVIERYEPRVKVTNVNVLLYKEYNRIIVEIEYIYIVEGEKINASLDVAFAYNTVSYIGGRYIPSTEIDVNQCVIPDGFTPII